MGDIATFQERAIKDIVLIHDAKGRLHAAFGEIDNGCFGLLFYDAKGVVCASWSWRPNWPWRRAGVDDLLGVARGHDGWSGKGAAD